MITQGAFDFVVKTDIFCGHTSKKVYPFFSTNHANTNQDNFSQINDYMKKNLSLQTRIAKVYGKGLGNEIAVTSFSSISQILLVHFN